MILIWVICMLIASGIVYAVIGYIPHLLTIAIAVCLDEGIFYSYFRIKKNIGFDVRRLDVKNAYHRLYIIPIFVSEILLLFGIILRSFLIILLRFLGACYQVTKYPYSLFRNFLNFLQKLSMVQ